MESLAGSGSRGLVLSRQTLLALLDSSIAAKSAAVSSSYNINENTPYGGWPTPIPPTGDLRSLTLLLFRNAVLGDHSRGHVNLTYHANS
jgi:hypothetical protein